MLRPNSALLTDLQLATPRMRCGKTRTLDLMADDVAMQMPDEEPSDLFVRVLAVDRAVADLLVANEITTLEEVAYVPEDELHSIEGLDQKLIPLMRQRAKSHLLRDVMGRQ